MATKMVAAWRVVISISVVVDDMTTKENRFIQRNSAAKLVCYNAHFGQLLYKS